MSTWLYITIATISRWLSRIERKIRVEAIKRINSAIYHNYVSVSMFFSVREFPNGQQHTVQIINVYGRTLIRGWEAWPLNKIIKSDGREKKTVHESHLR